VKRKLEGGLNERKTTDLAFFAMVRNRCTKPEMPPRFSELYE
jgi:hypothetical protein